MVSLFSVASKILSTIDCPAFKKACQRFQLTFELFRFWHTMETIKSVLLDAESQQEDSDTVKNWVERVKDAFHDAEEMFDKILASDPIKNELFEKVKIFFFGPNPITLQFRVIMKTLIRISEDMEQFQSMRCKNGKMRETGAFVDPNRVIGRLGDKKSIMDSIFDASQDIPVIAIVGAMGIGKTTLAQLVYDDELVQKEFEKRWWVCASGSRDCKQLIEWIFRAMTLTLHQDLPMEKVVSGIRQSVCGNRKFLIVLDGVVDNDRYKWLYVLSLLRSNAAAGSKIIVTTRYSSIARAMGAVRIHRVKRLSDDESWELFEKIALTGEKKNDPYWINLGKEAVKKCSNVPLAIKIKACLLFMKSTASEWRLYKNHVISVD